MSDRFNSCVSTGDSFGRFAYYLKRPSCAGQPNAFALQSQQHTTPKAAPESLSAASHSRLLLPMNLSNCPLEIFSFVNEFAAQSTVSLTLLHVVDPASCKPGLVENRLLAAKGHLERLASKFVRPGISADSCVCAGKPAEEILTHAGQSKADLIILSSYKDCSPRRKPQSDIVEQVLGSAPCDVSLLSVRTHFDCEEQWAAVEDVVAALNYVGLLKPSNRWTLVAS